jgi:hypothetical protein
MRNLRNAIFTSSFYRVSYNFTTTNIKGGTKMLTREEFNVPYLKIAPDDAEARLQECIEFINTKRPDLEKNFRQQFFRPLHWEQREGEPARYTHIMWDFAPLSFYFEEMIQINGEWKRNYNGGIIFHGTHDGGGNGSAPTFSVNIEPVDGWAIHT